MSTYDRVKHVIVDILEFNEDMVTPEADLTEGLGLDSLDKVDLVMGVEEEFNISVPDKDVPQIKTVKDLVEYIGWQPVRKFGEYEDD